MKGLLKYLVGGVVGAVFGFLVAPKRAQRVRDALLGRESAPALPEQLLRSLPPAMFVPPPAASTYVPAPSEAPPLMESGQVEAPPVLSAEPEGAAEATPVELPVTVEEGLAADAVWEAAAHLEAEALPPAFAPEQPALAEEPEPAAQPMPWAQQEQASTVLPEQIREQAASFVPGVMEPIPDEETEAESEPTLTLVDGPEPELAPEPEEPLESEPAAEFEPAAEPEAVLEPEPAEELELAPLLEPAPDQEVAPEPVPAAETVLESAAAETSEVVSVQTEDVMPSAAVEMDLRARIEETRRRIREEIERPFRVAEMADEADASLGAISPTLDVTPSEGSPTEPVPAVATEPVLMPAAEPAVSLPPVLPAAAAASAPQQGEFDYDAMRRRIEETRSRLKAKAFDAMMSGETSLLAQTGASGGGQTGAAAISLDEDVDRSIESGLSAEDA